MSTSTIFEKTRLKKKNQQALFLTISQKTADLEHKVVIVDERQLLLTVVRTLTNSQIDLKYIRIVKSNVDYSVPESFQVQDLDGIQYDCIFVDLKTYNIKKA